MDSLYIGIILFCRVAQHLCNKKTSNEIRELPVFIHYAAVRQILSALLAVLLIIIARNGFHCDFRTVLIAAFSGLMLVLNMACSITALKSGTIALNSLFNTAGLLVPCFAGIFLFNQPMSFGQWIGLAVLFVAAYLLIGSSKSIYKGFSAKTLLILLGGMLSNGCIMLAQEMFSHYVPDGSVSVFSFFSFGILGLFLTVLTPITYRRSHREIAKLSPSLIRYGVILSLTVFIINQLVTLSASLIPPAVLFAFVNGGSMMIGAIVAAVKFHEKLTVKSAIGIMLGLAALIMIKIL